MVDVDGGDVTPGGNGEDQEGEGIRSTGDRAGQRRAGGREGAAFEEQVEPLTVRTGGGIRGYDPRFHRTFGGQGVRRPDRTWWRRSLTVRIWRRRVMRRRLA